MADITEPPVVAEAAAVVASAVIVPGPVTPPPLTAVQLALYAGWTMAVLYGHLDEQPAEMPTLRTANELQPTERRELELARLRHLLSRIASAPSIAPSDLVAQIPVSVAGNIADNDALRPALTELNLTILEALTVGPPDIQLAYELGRSLRDTANPPVAATDAAVSALAQQFRRDRIAKLQEWLANLGGQFPAHAAPVVSTSLGRWSEFADVTLGTHNKLRSAHRSTLEATIRQQLLPQGDAWLMLLIGGRPTAGLLSPESYVAAAEEALHRSAATIGKVLRHYWFAALIVIAALGGVLYLIISYLSGAALVWSCIATVGGSVGGSASAAASRIRGLAAEAAAPVFAASEEDAMAWAITMLPAVKLSHAGVRKLRKAGIAPSSSLGRV